MIQYNKCEIDLRKLECDFFKKELLTSFTFEVDDTVCTPFFFSRGVEPLTKFSERRGLDRTSIFRGRVAGKEGVTFSRERRGAIFI